MTTAMITRPFHDPGEDHADHGEELRGGEDPEDLADDVRSGFAAAEPGRARRRSRATITVHRVRSCEKRTTIASTAAIQSAMPHPPLLQPERRPARAVIDGARRVAQHGSTVPRWCRQPGPPDPAQRALRGLRLSRRDGRGRRPPDRRRSRRRGTHRARAARPRAATTRGRSAERGEVARALDAVERVEERVAAVVPAVGAVALVECRVDGRGRRLSRAVREDEHDPEVLRQVDRREHRAVAGAEPRPVDEEERDVGADLGRDVVQLLVRRAARRACRSRAGVRSPRRSCRRRDRPRRGCASRSSRASAGSTAACAASSSSASRTSVSSAKPSTRVCSAGSTSMRSAMPMRW